jgi:tetratricopeptide (TPR) repeat protein
MLYRYSLTRQSENFRRAIGAPGGVVMRHTLFVRMALVFAVVAALLTACSRDPNVRKQKYFESGQRYFAKAKYREAIIQYRNAVDVDPNFGAAHYQLAQAYLKLQDLQHAYGELSRTLELQPDNYKAHADIANILVLSGQAESLKIAQEHVELLQQKQPNDPDTHIAAGNLLSREQKYSQAISEMQKAVTLGPDRGDAYLDLAILQAQANQPEAAEANFKKAIGLKASGTNPRLMLAAFYQSRSRYAEAEQQVQQMIAADPKDAKAREAMAKLYLAQGRKAEAEAFLKQVKQDLPDDSEGYRMLGDFYFLNDELDKAVAEYQSLYHDHPKDVIVEKNYTQLLLLKKRVDEAEKVNDGVLKSHPNDAEALTYRGEIQMAKGKPEAAAQTLQSVLSNNPSMSVAHYQLGLALAQTGNLDRAAGEWHESVRLKPSVEAYRALAVYALQKRDMAGMEQDGAGIIGLQPGSAEGYAMRSLALMTQKQFAGAEQDARKAMELAPQSGTGYLEMGNLRFIQHQFSEAESWFKQALSHDPNMTDALQGLVNAYWLEKKPELAFAAANQQIAISPSNSWFYDILGSLYLNRNDYPNAIVALKKSVELDKTNGDAYLKLARAQRATGAVDDALVTCANASRDNPREAEFYMMAGSAYEAKHDLQSAQKAYESALRLRHDDPLASNNLAYVLLETGGNADIALPLAQTARRALPELSNVADTLGFAFYQKGVYSSAISMFQEALRLSAKNKEPENPVYHYHLGLAYVKAERPLLAREQLERVLKIDPNYSDADDVKKQLHSLKL